MKPLPEYHVWNEARRRCHNPKCKDYPKYGARGISMCGEWRESFLAFISWMGPRPPGQTLERIDNNGNYCPENCRWATRKEQCLNSRRNHRLKLDGVTMTVSQWAGVSGIDESTIRSRIRRGWSVADTLRKPVQFHRCQPSSLPDPIISTK